VITSSAHYNANLQPVRHLGILKLDNGINVYKLDVTNRYKLMWFNKFFLQMIKTLEHALC